MPTTPPGLPSAIAELRDWICSLTDQELEFIALWETTHAIEPEFFDYTNAALEQMDYVHRYSVDQYYEQIAPPTTNPTRGLLIAKKAVQFRLVSISALPTFAASDRALLDSLYLDFKTLTDTLRHTPGFAEFATALLPGWTGTLLELIAASHSASPRAILA